MNLRVCHLTSVHRPFDTRIFHKECKALRKAGYEVTLIAPHDQSDCVDGIRLLAVPKPDNRFQRYWHTRQDVLEAALAERADIYHFHDPELIPIGLELKARGKRVIYDVHEDYPSAFATKKWIPGPMRKLAARWIRRVEQRAASRFDALVTATPDIDSKFPHARTAIVQNFAVIEPLDPSHTPYRERLNRMVYIGAISRTRAAHQMLDALHELPGEHNADFLLAGAFADNKLQGEMESMPGWVRTHYHGYAQTQEIPGLLATARVGIALLFPLERYLTCQPVKLYEYMAAELPVIASDFPYWRQMLEGIDCAIWTDPEDADAIRKALEWVYEHPEEAERMGKEGRKAVEEKFNWANEEKVLLELYADLLSDARQVSAR